MTAKRRRRPEQGLQIAVARFLEFALTDAQSYWFAVPNGFYRTPAEAGISKAMGQKAGAPDLVVIHRGAVFGIELKNAGGHLSAAQKRTHELLSCAGMRIAICRSLDEVVAALDGWLIPLRARTFGFVAPPRRMTRRARPIPARGRARPRMKIRKLKIRRVRRA